MSKYFAPRVKARVEKETKYKIRFREHYSATVVNVFDTLEGIQDGRLDIGGFCVCFDDDKAMAMNLGYYVPFSHPNSNVAVKIFRRIVEDFPAINQDYEGRYNQKLIALSGFNNYGLLTRFDWERFEDLKGHKILAAGPNMPWVKGGIPVRTTIPKAAQQLQTGVGEGITLFPDTIVKLKLHEATGGGYYTMADFGAVVQISLNMNLNARKKLPREVLTIIDEEAREVRDPLDGQLAQRPRLGHSETPGGRRPDQADRARSQEGLGRAPEDLAQRARPGGQGQEVHRHAGHHARLHQIQRGDRPRLPDRLPD